MLLNSINLKIKIKANFIFSSTSVYIIRLVTMKWELIATKPIKQIRNGK